jgi:very-short-patch-repair endonuclease
MKLTLRNRIVFLSSSILFGLMTLAYVSYGKSKALMMQLEDVSQTQLPAIRHMTLIDMYHDGTRSVVLDSLLSASEKNFAQRNYELKNLPRSKELRSNMTDHEKILWYKINNDQLDYKFRRQQPIGNYIVDFVCFERNLIIELDGSGHAEKKEYDANRDQFLQNQGFRILRLWNNEFLENVNGIMDYIVELLTNLKLTPHQNRFAILTPPQGGS